MNLSRFHICTVLLPSLFIGLMTPGSALADDLDDILDDPDLYEEDEDEEEKETAVPWETNQGTTEKPPEVDKDVEEEEEDRQDRGDDEGDEGDEGEDSSREAKAKAKAKARAASTSLPEARTSDIGEEASGDASSEATLTHLSTVVRYQMPIGEMQGFLNPALSYRVQAGIRRAGLTFGGFVSLANHNGCYYLYQVRGECSGRPGVPGPLIQGDSRITKIGAFGSRSLGGEKVDMAVEARVSYVSIPLLMDQNEYQEEVVFDTWGGSDPGFHDQLYLAASVGFVVTYPKTDSGPKLRWSAEADYIPGFDIFAAVGAGLETDF
jgi:hypothetical protein